MLNGLFDRSSSGGSAPWPDGKSFAFTIFDDPDAQTLEESQRVYGFLEECGLRTTKGVWPKGPTRTPNSPGETCANPTFLSHVRGLQSRGFEIGYHNATPHSAIREETIEALKLFKDYFGRYPSSMSNHYNAEAIYWGSARLSGMRRTLYNVLTLGRKANRFFGHVPGHRFFWGDVCQKEIRYCRNFVFRDVNTLAACPWMPYRDPKRPYVQKWFSSSEGSKCSSFCETLSEENQDRLESEGGACIMYAHLGHGFVDTNGHLDPRFKNLIQRLSRRSGLFVPVSTLLDLLSSQRVDGVIDNRQQRALEVRWLAQKVFRGTS